MASQLDAAEGFDSRPSVELSYLSLPPIRPAATSPVQGDHPPNSEGLDITPTRNETALHPVDGGWRAWSFLGGAFLVETFAWGFPTSYGVFLSAYINDPKWSSQPRAEYLLPLIGTLSSGLLYCASFLLCPLANRFPKYRRVMMWTGTLLCGASLFGASYADKVDELLGLQGLLYAVGGAMLYAPIPDFLQEWFVKRRGLGYGVINAGTSFAGVFFPLVLPSLFDSFGTALTLRYLSVFITVLIAFALLLIRPRLPENRVHGPRRQPEFRTWLEDSNWWLLIIINTVQGFAYYVPIVWLPTYASALNVSSTVSSLSVGLLNGASVISRLCIGTLSDHFSPWVLALMMCASTSLATFILWGVTGHFVAGLLVFGLVYGTVAGGWFVLWGAFVKIIAKENPASSMMLVGILMLSTGLGNILSTPISTALLPSATLAASLAATNYDRDHYYDSLTTGFGVGGGRYQKMIVYVGTCFAGAALVALLGWAVEKTGFMTRARGALM